MKQRPGIYRRGKLYWINYRWQGQQYYESSGSPNFRDAQALLALRKAELIAGRVAIRSAQTLSVDELLSLYIAQIENPNTQKRYRVSQSVITKHCGTLRITEVDAFTFDRIKEIRRKEGVSPAGINRDLALPRAAFNFAVKRRLIAHSPLVGVTKFNEAKHRRAPRILSFKEEQRLLESCDWRLRTLVVLLLDSGMRVGIEGLRLKWADVDFDSSMIRVVQSKTAAGLRTLPMTEFAKQHLREWHSATKGVSEYVFFNPQRPSTNIRSVKTAWHRALKRASLAAFPIYACRANFATRLAGAGVSDTILDQLLGHSRRDVLRFYTATVPEHLRIAVARIDEWRREQARVFGTWIGSIEEHPLSSKTQLN